MSFIHSLPEIQFSFSSEIASICVISLTRDLFKFLNFINESQFFQGMNITFVLCLKKFLNNKISIY